VRIKVVMAVAPVPVVLTVPPLRAAADTGLNAPVVMVRSIDPSSAVAAMTAPSPRFSIVSTAMLCSMFLTAVTSTIVPATPAT
jgi:hypothetical protein